MLTFLPLWPTDRGWVRIWDFPRLQIAVLLVVASAGLLWAARARGALAWSTVAAALAAVIWQAVHVTPYTPLVPKQLAGVDDCPDGRHLSLLNVNVFQDNRNYDALLDLVARVDSDVLLLLETDERWARAVGPLERRYPYRIARPLPNTYGMMLFSKLPLQGEVLYRLQPRIPSIAARLSLPGAGPVTLHAVHPEPPMPGEATGERDVELVMVGAEVRDSGGAALVLGDLNDVGWSNTSRLFRRLSGMLDARVGRGIYPTYHADYGFARWPLDHMFVTDHFRLMDIDRLGDIGSDHFPIYYRVCMVADADLRLTPSTAPPEVREEAQEEVRQQRSDEDQ